MRIILVNPFLLELGRLQVKSTLKDIVLCFKKKNIRYLDNPATE